MIEYLRFRQPSLSIRISLFVLLIGFVLSHSQFLDRPNPLRPIIIHDIRVEGNQSVDASLIRSTLSFKIGQEYAPTVLEQRARESIKLLNNLKLFSDVAIYRSPVDTAEGEDFIIRVKELPTLAKIELKGNKKIKEDDIREAIDLLDGQVYSPTSIKRNEEKILDLYREKGYLLASIEVEEKEEEATAKKIIEFNIKEGKKVRVKHIRFKGNERLSDKKLKKQMETKEKRWWRSGEYKEDEFRASLDSIQAFYKDQGYLDAAVPSQKISYSEDKKTLNIDIDVSEGSRYYFGHAKFLNNTILDDKALQNQVLLDSGDVFNYTKYNATKQNIQSSYLEEGHLHMRVDDQKNYRDSIVDVTFDVAEGGISHIQKVMIRGNTKTKDKVVRREIHLFPGDVFRLSLLQRSARDIMQLNYFDNVNPNFEPAQTSDPNDVNLVMEVKEKTAGTGTFSAGVAYSARDRLVGTLGLQIPNFLGNGQRADMNVEYGANRQYYSLGFTEPWFMDTPTLLGGSIFYQLFNDPTGDSQKDYYKYGFSGSLGRRLTWPDDYFRVNSRYNLTVNRGYGNSNPDFLILGEGLESSLHFTIVRDDKDLPIFPTQGSRHTAQYSIVGGFLGGDFAYNEYQLKTEWWFPLFKKLVLEVEVEGGLIDGDNIQSFALYQMGGAWGYQGKLRGYSGGYTGRDRIGRSFFSSVAELSYPIVQNTFYLLGFFDAGNVFGRYKLRENIAHDAAISPWEEVDLSTLKRDFGFGFRLVVPMVGILGFDFGWPLDPDEGSGGIDKKVVGGLNINFVIEPPF